MPEKTDNTQKEQSKIPEDDMDWRHKIDWEKFYKVVLIIVSCLVPFFIYDMYKFRNYCDKVGYQYQSAWLIPQAFVMALLLTFYRNVFCKKILLNFFLKNINKKYVGQDREMRAVKCIKWASDIIYYGGATVYAIVYFSHKKWFPLYLNKDWYDQDMMSQWPDKVNDDVSYYMDIYLVIQFGQHIYSFFELYSRRANDPKFFEQTLHHVLALTLIFYSIFNNFYIPAVILLILHDVGDIFIAWFKLYGVFRTDTVFYLNTGAMIISWYITRIFIYPKGVILPLVDYFDQLYRTGSEEQEYQTITKPCYIYMLVLCSCLQGLHIYWFATMFTMLFKHLKQIIRSTKPVTFQNDFDFHKKNLEKEQKAE